MPVDVGRPLRLLTDAGSLHCCVVVGGDPSQAGRLEREALHAIASADGLVIDAGGGTPFTKSLAAYRSLFEPVDYRTLDIDPATNPDIVGDIHHLPLEDGTVDAFICRSVLEHIRDPRQALHEMHRALRPGGQLLVTVPSVYPYHARPGHYPDLWRFFEEGLRVLLEDFTDVRLQAGGGPATRMVIFSPVLNRAAKWLRPIALAIDDRVARSRGRRNPSFLTAWARKAA